MVMFLCESQKELEFPQIDVSDAQFTETMSWDTQDTSHQSIPHLILWNWEN